MYIEGLAQHTTRSIMDIFLIPFLSVLQVALSLYGWVILMGVVLNWLIVFRIVNPYQAFIQNLNHIYYVLVDRFLMPLRRVLPMMGALDLSPFIVWLGVQFLLLMIDRLLLRLL